MSKLVSNFICLDYSDLSILGSGNDHEVSIPYVTFSVPSEACRNSTYDNQCIVTKQVDSSLSRIKIGMWTNRMRFDQLEYF